MQLGLYDLFWRKELFIHSFNFNSEEHNNNRLEIVIEWIYDFNY